jgi:hypothetical protein
VYIYIHMFVKCFNLMNNLIKKKVFRLETVNLCRFGFGLFINVLF